MSITISQSLKFVGHQFESVSNIGDFEFRGVSLLVERFDGFDLAVNHMVWQNAAITLQAAVAMQFDFPEIEMFVGDFNFSPPSVTKIRFGRQKFIFAEQYL